MSYEEIDPSMIEEIQEMLTEFQAQFDSIRVKTLLSGEYDSENAIIKLNAGAGGTEACDWCSMLYRMYTRWAERKGFSIEVLDYLDGDEAGVKSVTSPRIPESLASASCCFRRYNFAFSICIALSLFICWERSF